MDKWNRQAKEESEIRSTAEGWWASIKEGSVVIAYSYRRAPAAKALAAWRKARAAELRGRAAAPAFSALGATVRNAKTAAAARENGRKGGRPRTAGANDWAMKQARAESRVTKTVSYWLSVYSEGQDGGGRSSGPYPSRRAAWPDLRAWREKRAAELREEGRDR